MNAAELIELRDLVNDTATLPCDAALDVLGPDAPAASVQQLPGTRWLDRYIDGSGVTQAPFAVTLRTSGDDTAGRASAAAALYALADALEELTPDDLPQGWQRIEGTDTPSLVARDEDGSEVWRATFALESKRSGDPAVS